MKQRELLRKTSDAAVAAAAPEAASIDEVALQARAAARQEQFAVEGQIVAITAGTTFGASSTTSLWRLAVV